MTDPPSRRRRVIGLLAMAAAVAVVHVIVVFEFGDRLRSFAPGVRPMQAMEVAFVRALKPIDTPAVAPAPPLEAPAPPPVPRVLPPARAASAPTDGDAPAKARKPKPPRPVDGPVGGAAPAGASPSPIAVNAIDVGEDAPGPAASSAPSQAAATPVTDGRDPAAASGIAEASASAPVAPVASAASAAAPTSAGGDRVPASAAAAADGTGFDWPLSTQLRYVLKGNYRGEVEGSAKVQWVRIGARYEVLLEVAIGPSFAPLMSRRMVSQGDLGVAGLVPRRYEERTRIGFSVRQFAMSFDDGRAVLADGARVGAPLGMQDSSSQFVQMSYLFTRDPALLQPGRSIAFPVALPRRLNVWVYDVVGEETLPTPLGELRTFHVKPRRDAPRPGELVAQAWFAPSLQYLPVRILIHQDAETFVDMRIDGAPMQAQPER